MTSPRKLAESILVAMAIGALALVLTAYALRPHKGLVEPVGLSTPEWFLAGFVGVVSFIAALVRSLRRQAPRRELDSYLEATSGDDRL